MHIPTLFVSTAIILAAMLPAGLFAEPLAKIRRIDGTVSVLKKDAETWRIARINMPLEEGDAVYSKQESFAEVVYSSGAILRMSEETKIVVSAAGDKGASAALPVGNVWCNMRKLVTSKKEFALESPTATAAIRGTVFQMNTASDSSTDVSVFEGKVAVAPAAQAAEKKPAHPEGAHEVPGPQEIPGPREVTLEQWRMIVAGQKISVSKDGTFSEKKFDMKKAAQDAFVKKNIALDKEVEKESIKKQDE